MATEVYVKEYIQVGHRLINLPKPSAEYIAGFFDADGSVGAYSRIVKATGYVGPEYVQVCLTNTCLEVLLAIEAFYGGRIEKGKSWYSLRLSNIPSKVFLEDIRPFVIVKRKQVEIALEICNFPVMRKNDPGVPERKAKRTALAQQLRELKKNVN